MVIARVVMLSLLLTSTAKSAELVISAARCDELLAKMPSDPWVQRKEASVLAWNESPVLLGLLDLYIGTKDRKYLDEFVRRADQVLSHRDDKRGFKDFSGQSHPRWSIATKYTVAEGTLVDAAGNPSLKLRSTASANNQVTIVRVEPDEVGFTLRISNRVWKRDETFTRLSLDPSSDRYFAKIVNNPEPLPKPPAGATTDEPSLLIRIEPAVEKPNPPKSQSITLSALWHAHVGYVGIIYHPLLEFALLVKSDPSLANYKPAADRYVTAAEESYASIADYWRNGPGENEGYYIGSKPNGAAPYDSIGQPFNYQAKHACSEIALFELTGKPQYEDHAVRIATHLKNRLSIDKNDAYVWKYWFEPVTEGWAAKDNVCVSYPSHAPYRAIEDASHATLEIAMLLAMRRTGLVFDDVDRKRFTNTFLKNVVKPDRSDFNAGVDGTAGGAEFEGAAVFGWLPLTEIDPAVYEVCRQIYLTRGKEDFKSLARLVRYTPARSSNGPPSTLPAQ